MAVEEMHVFQIGEDVDTFANIFNSNCVLIDVYGYQSTVLLL